MHSGRLRGSLISVPTISIELLLRLQKARLILPNTMGWTPGMKNNCGMHGDWLHIHVLFF